MEFPESLIFLLLPMVAFPLFWMGIVAIIGMISGWSSLATHYGAPDEGGDRARHMRSLNLRRNAFLPGNYSSIVTIGVDSQALYLSVMIVFRVGHTPLKIPFNDISIEKNTGILRRLGTLTTIRQPDIQIQIPMKDIEWIETTYGELGT